MSVDNRLSANPEMVTFAGYDARLDLNPTHKLTRLEVDDNRDVVPLCNGSARPYPSYDEVRRFSRQSLLTVLSIGVVDGSHWSL